MDDSGILHGPLRNMDGEPLSSPKPYRRCAAWVVALALIGGLTAGVWVGTLRVRESAARVH